MPKKGDPLHLDQILTAARNLLDECFRQTIDGPSSIPIHLAFGVERYVTILSLREIGNVCNTLDRECSTRLAYEHPYLIRIYEQVENKYVLGYYVPNWRRDFFLDPNRSRYLYSTSLVIDKCQTAIKSLILDLNPDPFYDHGVTSFFTPTLLPFRAMLIEGMANATRLLESTRNGSDRNELLLFLKYLSEICWFDIYCRACSVWSQRHLTNGIVHWVCNILVG